MKRIRSSSQALSKKEKGVGTVCIGFSSSYYSITDIVNIFFPLSILNPLLKKMDAEVDLYIKYILDN